MAGIMNRRTREPPTVELESVASGECPYCGRMVHFVLDPDPGIIHEVPSGLLSLASVCPGFDAIEKPDDYVAFACKVKEFCRDQILEALRSRGGQA